MNGQSDLDDIIEDIISTENNLILNSCRYLSPEHTIEENHLDSTSLLHLNICGLYHRIGELKSLICHLSSLHIQPDIILLCGTFLNDNNTKLCQMQGYQIITKNQSVKKGGGIAILAKDGIKLSIMDNLSIHEEGVYESLFIKIPTSSE